MRCNHLKVSDVKVTASCISPLADCEVAYNKTCTRCEYLKVDISYEVHR
jgi:hypothetical protein